MYYMEKEIKRTLWNKAKTFPTAQTVRGVAINYHSMELSAVAMNSFLRTSFARNFLLNMFCSY